MKDTAILPGYKQTKVGMIPDEWSVAKFSQVCKKALNGGTPSTKIPEYWEGTIPWITGADVVDQRIREVRKYITAEAVENSATHVIPKGMLLLVTRTGVGKVAIAPFDIAISQDLTGIIPTDNASVEYLFWTFNRANGHFLNMNQGTSINGIKRNDLMDFALPLPPLPEQHQIATILSTVDAAITATDEVIAKTGDLKRGLMQDLLTKGIAEAGRVRSEEPHAFCEKGGMRVPVEWEVAKLSKYSSVRTGPFGAQLHQSDYVEIGTPIITVEHLGDLGIIHKNLPLVSDEDKNRLRIFILDEGDSLITRREKGWLFSGRLLRVRPSKERIDPKYLSCYFNHTDFKRRIQNLAVGGTMPSLNTHLMSNILVSLPPLPEQHRIATILSTVDRDLATERHHRARLQTLKQGLMQDLLTGRKRVPLNGGEAHGA
jgi:type I restriction enzyme S subunit